MCVWSMYLAFEQTLIWFSVNCNAVYYIAIGLEQ